MKISDREIKNLITRLSDVFCKRSGKGMPSEGLWVSDVMRLVRSVGPHGRALNGFYGFVSWFGDVTWRLMPAALIVLILLSVMDRFIDDSLQYQVNRLITADPVGIYDIMSFFYGV